MQCESEHKTRLELDRELNVDSLPSQHLRECEIIEHMENSEQANGEKKGGGTVDTCCITIQNH